jgi:protein-serine/threonine kinase
MEGHFLVLQHLLISIHPTSSDLDQVDCEGNTPLHYAARLRDQRAIELLLDHGASSVICNLDGQSPLTLCPDGPGYDLLRDSMERRNKQRDQFAIPRLAGSEPLLSSISLILPSIPLIPASVSLDSFTPLGLLGKGQFGEVFLVQYIPTGQLYAMKSVSKGRDMKQYLRTERNVLARLDHPFIVRLHWAFQTSSNLYLVVDYCPAGDLAELLRNEGKLTEDAAKFFAAEVVLAIEALHKENVVYRDLKPENIVLDLNGHIRLTDFGLAKEMSMSASSHSFCGPLCYFPPEMVREQRHTQAVDWYMLGCLLYEMVVGEPPFKAHDETKLFMKIEQGKVSFPAGISLSNEAKDLIRKLLRVEVVKRLGNAGAEEVKCHPFFTGTDWSLVQAKQCSAPVSTPRKRPASLQGRCAYICKEDRPDRHVDWWTFCRGQ